MKEWNWNLGNESENKGKGCDFEDAFLRMGFFSFIIAEGLAQVSCIHLLACQRH